MGEKDKEQRNRSGTSRSGAKSSSSKGSAEDRHRKHEDRKNSRNTGTSRPGAVPSTSGTRSSGKNREGKEKEAKTSSKSSHGTSKSSVGAHSSSGTSASDRERRKEERNRSSNKSKDSRREDKSRNGSDKSIGARSSSGTTASDRERRKEERNRSSNKSKDRTREEEEPVQKAPIDEGFAVEATAVNDDEANERVRKLEQQMAAMMQSGAAGTSTSSPGVTSGVAIADGSDDGEESSVDDEDKPFFQKYRYWILFAVILAIGGGVAGYLLGQGSESSTPVSSPSVSKAAYEKPDALECKKVAEEVVVTKDKMFVDLIYEITVAEPATVARIQSSLVALTDATQDSFVPLLAGCDVSPTRRRLASADLRYMIADAVVGSAQQIEDKDVVMTASVPMEVYIKGQESAVSVASLISTVFNDEGGAEKLNLPYTISAISLQSVKASSNPPTDTPTPNADPTPTAPAPVDGPTLEPAIPPTPSPVAGPPPSPPTTTPPAPVNPTPAPVPVTTPTQAPVMSPPTTTTPAPVGPPVILDATARRNLIQELVGGNIGDTSALYWISDMDTWQPEC